MRIEGGTCFERSRVGEHEGKVGKRKSPWRFGFLVASWKGPEQKL